MKNLGLRIFVSLYILVSLYIGLVFGLPVLGLITPIFTIILGVLLIIHPITIISYDGIKAKAIHFRVFGVILLLIAFMSRLL